MITKLVSLQRDFNNNSSFHRILLIYFSLANVLPLAKQFLQYKNNMNLEIMTNKDIAPYCSTTD